VDHNAPTVIDSLDERADHFIGKVPERLQAQRHHPNEGKIATTRLLNADLPPSRTGRDRIVVHVRLGRCSRTEANTAPLRVDQCHRVILRCTKPLNISMDYRSGPISASGRYGCCHRTESLKAVNIATVDDW
jgi:hypothetical protein